MKTGCTARRNQGAFTLVELLVVIGIIAVLISVLLPTLAGVRKQANLVQCSSNMRQVCSALIMYINDSKGRLPPATVKPLAGVLPNGWWWPNELVRGKYIPVNTVNVYRRGPNTGKVFSRNNPFRCPEGLDEDFAVNGNGGGDYPTDSLNNGYSIENDAQCAADGFGIPSWYQLNCRNQSLTNGLPTGKRVTPFVYFNLAVAADLKDVQWQRSMGMIRRSAEMLMVVEATNSNWFDQAESGTHPGNFLRRLAGRHGKKTADGANAYTNMAFFDGHVALYPTRPFENPKDQMDNQVKDVIFYVTKQKGY